MYAALRPLLLGLNSRQRVYQVASDGAIAPFAELEFLAGGPSLERKQGATRLYEGLPPYMAFAAPSGFLGRHLAQAATANPVFPRSLKDWGDEHCLAYLFTHGLNLPGNLVYGEAALQLELDFRSVAPIAKSKKLAHYQKLATTLGGTAYGSSAGGEQPKFLALTQDTGHVIVKFAKQGSRMAALLPLEHLALRCLSEADVAAAKTQLLAADDYVFLEVQRFDRLGPHGRVGMLSAGSIDDEVFGLRDNWSAFAARCEQARLISAADARRIDTMAAFSELIGNTDRHFENISLLVGDDGEYAGVAPAYDILPMRYASVGGGLDPQLLPIEPKIGAIGAKPEVWATAAQAALRFWAEAQAPKNSSMPVPADMMALAKLNLEVVKRFVQPLLPSGLR